jgi:hypothetical protein
MNTASGDVPIGQTELYTKLARECHDIDLSKWDHPVRSVLARYAVKLSRVQLCNDNMYLIMTVGFKYDPRGETTDYFHELYGAIESALGGRPFSFVDLPDLVVINAAPFDSRNLRISYESLTTPP